MIKTMMESACLFWAAIHGSYAWLVRDFDNIKSKIRSIRRKNLDMFLMNEQRFDHCFI